MADIDLLRAAAVITVLEAEVATLQRQLAEAKKADAREKVQQEDRDMAFLHLRDALLARGVSKFELGSIMMGGDRGAT